MKPWRRVPEPRSPTRGAGAKNDARAFTLIELLVVVAIIAVLIGITLRITSYVTQKTARSRAIRDLEQLKNALAAYYADNGIYPPAAVLNYEYENTNYSRLPVRPPGGMQLVTGLVYYLQFGPGASRWAHYLSGLGFHETMSAAHFDQDPGSATTLAWSNNLRTILDPWDRSYTYVCREPFQTYELWTHGPTTNMGDEMAVKWPE
jgi:prepilin-type N-terminal cleavage/methylation domain-containing protein